MTNYPKPLAVLVWTNSLSLLDSYGSNIGGSLGVRSLSFTTGFIVENFNDYIIVVKALGDIVVSAQALGDSTYL
jgi:hypothetical protein